MKHRLARGPMARAALLSCLAIAGGAASWAAPMMSVEAQALAHWVHYTRLNVDRQHADAPFIVVDAGQLRWWLVDATGQWYGYGYGAAPPWWAVDRPPFGLPPVLRDPALVRERVRSSRGSGGD